MHIFFYLYLYNAVLFLVLLLYNAVLFLLSPYIYNAVSRENVGWASTCNAVGQTAGYFMGNVVFLALESPEFCNNYLRSVPQATGLVTIQGVYPIPSSLN